MTGAPNEILLSSPRNEALDLDGNIFAEAIQIDITSKRECPGDTFSSKKEVSK